MLLLTLCFNGLNTYGKEPEQLEDLAQLFQFKLERFTWKQVKQAFNVYTDLKPTMPAPSDIISIIEPQPVWCKSTFQEIKKMQKAGEFVSDDELRYCEEFLAASVKRGIG